MATAGVNDGSLKTSERSVEFKINLTNLMLLLMMAMIAIISQDCFLI